MSYCRFSSDDFSCDVYVYEGGSGFVTHVAGNRVIGDIPKVPQIGSCPNEEFMAAHRAQMAYLGTAEREDINLPHAGESMSHDTADDCADNLESLRAIGYNVPQSAIDRLREDAKAIEREE